MTRTRRRLASQSGFTLVEMLIAMVVLVFAVSATLWVLERSQSLAHADMTRANTIQAAQSGLYRMSSELRAGYPPADAPLPTSAGNTLDLIVNLGGTPTRVRYDCSVPSADEPAYKSCVRYASTVLSAPPTTSPMVVIDGVANGGAHSEVFTPNSLTAPTVYTVRIDVPAKTNNGNPADDYNATLNDAIYLRNTLPANRADGGQ